MLAQKRQILFADHAAIEHPHPLRLPVFRFHGSYDRGDGLAIVGVAGEDFVAQRYTFLGDHQTNADLHAIRSTVARIAALGQRIAGALSFKIGAGHVVEQQLIFKIE